MRAVTGAIVSSKPCSLLKAKGILSGFFKSSASNLPTSDAATYLLTAADAVDELCQIRGDIRRTLHHHLHLHHQQEGSPPAATGDGDGERRNKDKGRVKQEEQEAVVSKQGISLVPRKKKDIPCVIKQEEQEEPEHKKMISNKGSVGSHDKKRKHAAQDLVEVKKEEADFVDADLGSDKKKKKKKHKKNKRSRDGDDAQQEEVEVEHTKKKQRN
ncbi:hypothetical protein ZWY2020_059506 [Hordeum vulgare]|nr:hypothetical protein ZWY2020_059506 [Hordeum vulgare]